MGHTKSHQIAGWISRGLISDQYEHIFDKWKNSISCEKCSHDYSYHKKCMDHCHVTGAFRAILCSACNLNQRMDNTSGYPNIHKSGPGWRYQKTIKKVRYMKWFKTKEEAIKFKLEFES